MNEPNQVIHADCLDIMRGMPDKSIDMILCDLPYGTTACSWDITIPFEPLWEQYKRIIKNNSAIVLFGSQPFTTDLINSNRKWFKYEWIWNKLSGANFLMAKKMPLKYHENILIFYNNQPVYNPQMGKKLNENVRPIINKNKYKNNITNQKVIYDKNYDNYKNYPSSIIEINCKNKECNSLNRIHPTQKPVELFAYLIKTYTNENDIVLDNCAGVGTTAIACLKMGRRYICIEKEKKYIDIINQRIDQYHDGNIVDWYEEAVK